MIEVAGSSWKRLLIIAGAAVLTLGRLWHGASSLISQHSVESTAAHSDMINQSAASSGVLKREHHNHPSRFQPCSTAPIHHTALDDADLDRFVLLSYTLSSSTPGYEDLPKGSRAKMFLVQGSCDDSSSDDSSDDSGDGGAGGDGGEGDDSSDDSADYDDSDDSSDDA